MRRTSDISAAGRGSPSRPLRKLLAAAVAIALVLALAPIATTASEASADTPAACPAGTIPKPPFTDVAGNTHEDAIACLVARGITLGTTATTYAPRAQVRRDQMASFLDRLVTEAGGHLPAAPQTFPDTAGNRHAAAIDRLAAAGIVRGVADDRYAPGNPVTRGQMATFLVRTYEYLLDGEVQATPVSFTDTAGTTHADNIAKAATLGIAQGRTATTYAPRAEVRRDQMASFLTRLLDRNLTVEALLADTLEAPTFTVDAQLRPLDASAPPAPDGRARSVAVIADANGAQTEIVADELVISATPEVLAGFVSRWDAEVVATIDTAGRVPGLHPIHLVRVDPSRGDVEALPDLVQQRRRAIGVSHTANSRAALGLLAIMAAEDAAGLTIGLNPLATPATGSFTDGPLKDASTGVVMATGVPYEPDVSTWPHFRSGGVQDIGITDAWRALDVAGLFERRRSQKIRIAILDGGFADHLDLPNGSVGANDVAGVGTCSGRPCPWHGTEVTQVAMALPGNDIGTAGTAGLVALPIMVGASPRLSIFDQFELQLALTLSVLDLPALERPRIVNMSFGGAIGFWPAVALKPMTQTVGLAMLGANILPIASAGNEGTHLDIEECKLQGTIFAYCYQPTKTLPCQGESILCVGGLDVNSSSHHPDSNYGVSVDLWAPYVHYLGYDPTDPSSEAARLGGGTSFSAPYVAGVAALVMAADPSLTARQVRRQLTNTARAGTGRVNRYVQARTAVERTLGGPPPELEILTPSEGATVVRGNGFTASASVSDTSLPVRWVFAGEPVTISTARGITVPATLTEDLDPGSYPLTATVTTGPYTLTRTLDVQVINRAPVMTIERPLPDTDVFASDQVLLRARSVSGGSRLPDAAVTWYRIVGMQQPDGTFQLTPLELGTGHELVVPATSLASAGRSVRVRVVGDDGFDTGMAEVVVTIQADPVVPAPDVTITAPLPASDVVFPSSGTRDTNGLYYADVPLGGSAIDSNDGVLTGGSLVWTTTADENGDGVQTTRTIATGGTATGRLYMPEITSSTRVTHTIRLTATNSAGVSRTEVVQVVLSGLPL